MFTQKRKLKVYKLHAARYLVIAKKHPNLPQNKAVKPYLITFLITIHTTYIYSYLSVITPIYIIDPHMITIMRESTYNMWWIITPIKYGSNLYKEDERMRDKNKCIFYT